MDKGHHFCPVIFSFDSKLLSPLVRCFGHHRMLDRASSRLHRSHGTYSTITGRKMLSGCIASTDIVLAGAGLRRFVQ